MNKQQLASKIWQSANKMRSKIEANEYKDYILGFIFYKFLCEQEEQFLIKEGMAREEFPAVVEEDQETVEFLQNSIGYFVGYPNLYSTWLAMGKDFDISNVRDGLSAFSRLVSPTHKRVFDGIFRTLETGLSKLGENASSQTKAVRDLIHLIDDIPMDGKQGYDVLGFIYEYLIEKFAANAGKKAGEFYTPHEVSQLMSEIVADHLKDRPKIQIYDPTSGSGSLLITIGSSVAKRLGTGDGIKYYAQELKENTYNLTRMNLIMRGIKPDNIVVRNGDSLLEDWPWFDDNDPAGTYQPLYVDAVVSNPPYSQHWDPEGKEADPRFSYGMAPKSKADYAFLLHELYHLRPDGIMCIVLPHGVLFRGNEEGQIRRNLIEHNHIQAIIGLPANIFYGTGIPTIVMVLRQKRKEDDILIVDASKGFQKVGKNNQLRASDIKRIVDTVVGREDHPKFSRLVSKQEVRDNDYNLNIPRYVDSSEQAESWDVYASMFGGIPKEELDGLADYWDALPGLRESIFDGANEPYARLATDDVRAAIEAHPSVKAFRDDFESSFGDLSTELYEELVDEASLVPLVTEEQQIAQNVFERMEGIPLLDRYDAYQLIDNAWATISADLEVIQTEGFDAVRQVDPNMVVKTKNNKETEVQDGWVGHVIPFALVEESLLAGDLAALKGAEGEKSSLEQELEELNESFTEEDKQTEAFDDEKGTVVAATAKRLLKREELDEDLSERLRYWLDVSDRLRIAKRQVKQATAELDVKAKEAVEGLTDEQAQELLAAKWITPLCEQIMAMPNVAIDDLVKKIEALTQKYEVTYSDVTSQIEEAERSLCQMLGDLVGNDYDMAGIAEFQRLLGGASDAK